MSKQLKFKISQLRQDNATAATESIAVFIFSLFISVFLPNLLMQFVYTDPALATLPPVVQYTPLVAFVFAVGFFLYAMVSNFTRTMQVKKLEKELAVAAIMDESSCGCGGDCQCGHSHDNEEFFSMAAGETAVMDTPVTPTTSSKAKSIGLLAEKMKSTKSKKTSKK